ncbi:MAG: hypothetical protein ACRCXL_00230 [Dermatophilaceae bacterium]
MPTIAKRPVRAPAKIDWILVSLRFATVAVIAILGWYFGLFIYLEISNAISSPTINDFYHNFRTGVITGTLVGALTVSALSALVVGAVVAVSGRGAPLGWVAAAVIGALLDISTWYNVPAAVNLATGGEFGNIHPARYILGILIDLAMSAALAWITARVGLDLARRRRERVSKLA